MRKPDPNDTLPRYVTTTYIMEAWTLVEALRADEGDSVTIVSDNGDFSGPNSIILCNGGWTGWEDRSFSGDNVLAALQAAYQEFAALKEQGHVGS